MIAPAHKVYFSLFHCLVLLLMMTSPFHKVEFARAYRLTMTSIEPVSFSVPRVKAACFQVMLITMLTTLLVMNILIRTTCSHRRGTCGSQQWQRQNGWLEKTALRYAHFLFPASLSLSSLSGTLSLLLAGVGEPAARGHEDSVWPGPERECLIEVKNHLQRRLNKPIMDISEPDFSLVVSFKYVLFYCQWWSHKILCEVKCTLPIKL